MNQRGSKVRFVTLGCRVNQYETQGMRELLRQSGIEEWPGCTSCGPGASSPEDSQDIDYVVVNTCTVTQGADRESRYWIRRARREHPHAKIVVTGCGVEKDRESWREMPEVDGLLANDHKGRIAQELLNPEKKGPKVSSEGLPKKHRREYTPLAISRSDARTRAFVKIQDGCNHACSFCKVVLVRGRSRSRGIAEIIEEAMRLRDHGYQEVVLTGIQLGAYGRDFDKRLKLSDVLYACAKIEGLERLRLSSIEPLDVDEDLINALAAIPKCMPHLHLPLQSGDDDILKRMNRRYTHAFYLDLVERLRDRLPDFMLSLDVMTGFPGEGEPHFQNTIQLLKTVKPLKCHVFPYSRREGTLAARFDDSVKPEIVRQRVKDLIELGERLGREEMKAHVGRTVPVLAESFGAGRKKSDRTQDGESHTGILSGHTPNFMKVVFKGPSSWVGQLIPVRLCAMNSGGLTGESV